MNTAKLKNYQSDLITWGKYTDALFVGNLIAEIEKRPKIERAAVERWLQSAFQDDIKAANTQNDNCIHLYNRDFHRLIIGQL